MIKPIRTVLITFALIVAPLGGSLAMVGSAHATGATFTWTGGDASSGDWSVGDNWSGGTAPQSSDSGDTIVIDNSANFSHGSTDDISGFSIADLKFENNGTTSNPIQLIHGLTVTDGITQEPSDTTTVNSLENGGTAETITIGGNVTITSSAGLILGGQSTPDTIAVTGGDTLTFADSGTPDIDSMYDVVTGTNVTVTYNVPATQFQLYDDNSYSGTTNVQNTFSSAPGLVILNADPFGTSTVNVGAGGNIEFQNNISSLNNVVNIAGPTSGQPPVSLNWGDLLSGTFTIPNIVLNGNTDFSNDAAGNLTVNLAGATANGFCVSYTNTNDPLSLGASANTFTNGPAGCSSSSSGSASGAGLPKAGGLRSPLDDSIFFALSLLGIGAVVAGYNEYNRRRKPF